ncbi:hypothetical protein [Roseovarius arcticus]|uniref:hypothetical protein n=1 Tax=Roseovarius arcticus TaxID=2547404 RepID=UPI0011101146|nr:hypothetical protein [Roseovarius arcticus]
MAQHEEREPADANSANTPFTVQDFASGRNRPIIAPNLWPARLSGLDFLWLAKVDAIWPLAASTTSFCQGDHDCFAAQPRLLMLLGVGAWVFTMIDVLVFPNRWFLKQLLIANILIAAGASYFHETMTSVQFDPRNPRRV